MDEITVEPQSLDRLLQQVTALREKYKVITQLSPNHFNIFNILKVERKEESTHSAVIAELLNPNGSHKLGSRFLSEFLKYLNLEDKLDLNSTEVITEYYTGKISKDSTEGGAIDIYLKSNNGTIIIENKIDAGDQNNQLLRYHNFDPNSSLVYLTLDGHEPSNKSLGSLDIEDVLLSSYKTDIIKWLEKCVEIAVNTPFVRETINQYIIVLKQLTNQSLYWRESMEVVDKLFENDENVLTYLYLQQFQGEIEDRLNKRIKDEVEKVAKELKFEVQCFGSFYKAYSGFQFIISGFENFPIRFEFQSKGLNNLISGFKYEEISNEADSQKLYDLVKSVFSDCQKTKVWPAFTYWHDYRWWNYDEDIALFEGGFRKDLIKRLLKYKDILESIV